MGDNPPLTPLKRSGVKPTSQKGGNLIAAHSGDNGDKDSGDDCDSSESKNDDESLVADEPPANNRNQMNRERTAIPLLLSSRKLLSSFFLMFNF